MTRARRKQVEGCNERHWINAPDLVLIMWYVVLIGLKTMAEVESARAVFASHAAP